MKWRSGAVVGFIMCGLLSPPPVSAQVPGERIRVTLVAERIVGVIAESRPDEFLFTDGGGASRTLAHEEIQRLERSLGLQSQWRRGLLYGALSGVALAGLNALRLGDDDSGGFLSFSTEERFLLGSLVFGGLGVAIGTVVGALIKRERWQEIEDWGSLGSTPRLMVDLSAGPGGSPALLIGGQFRFQ